MHGHLGGMPPVVDLAKERELAEIMVAGSRDGLIAAAHDVSDGGIMQTLVEMALRSNIGARIWVPTELDPFVFAYAESTARVVVVLPRSEELRFVEMCNARGYAITRIGVVDSELASDAGAPAGTQFLQLDNAYGETIRWTLDELRTVHEATLPAVLN